jgi:hypothetical protein
MAQQTLWAWTSSLSRFYGHTQINHTRLDSSGRAISFTQRPLPGNTQHLQETAIHAPGGIRTHKASQQAAYKTVAK